MGLTASAGVAPNKFVAKIASDLEKPDGLVEVGPGQEAAFLRDLPLRRLWGVGPSAERELAALGARTIGDLARLGRTRLEARLGASGAHLWELAQGIDERPVVPWHDPKSIGAEETFGRDTRDVGAAPGDAPRPGGPGGGRAPRGRDSGAAPSRSSSGSRTSTR